MLRELQHRVKNNLQMITALIRLEGRALPDQAIATSFDRLAGRIEALAPALPLAVGGVGEENVDLGTYLSEDRLRGDARPCRRRHPPRSSRRQLAGAARRRHARRAGRQRIADQLAEARVQGPRRGTITLHCIVGRPAAASPWPTTGSALAKAQQWPVAGKMSALIVKSLAENARARIEASSTPGAGMRVEIHFDRADAEA